MTGRNYEAELKLCLKKYWGYSEFLGGQLDIILNILHHKDAFVVMATGSGKSLTFQLPSVYLRDRGIVATTIVISPLISLIDDQVASLLAMGIAACAIGSNSSPDIEQRAIRGEFPIIYATPEKMNVWQSSLRELMRHSKLVCVTIDESHCVSEWGHDFRPEYRRIGDLRAIVGSNTPFIGLTASATTAVQADIIRNLKLCKPLIVRSSLNRSNLKYSVLDRTHTSDLLKVIYEYRQEQMIDVAPSDAATVPFYSTLIYVNSKKETEELANLLVNCSKLEGIKAAFYHAGMSSSDRSAVHMAFAKDHVQVVVATIAFGMGINKPDVRLVIHYGMTKSIEAYYQQTGRAGRDGLPARCILLFNRQDVVKSFNVAARDMNMQSVASLSVASAAAALMEEDRAAMVPPTIELSFEDHLKQDPLQRLKFQLQCMKEYATGCGQYHCRRRYLLRYFGEDIAVNINGSEGGSSCCDLCDMRGSINSTRSGSYSDPPNDGSKQSNIHDIRDTSSGGIAIDASDMVDVSYEVYMLLSTIIDSGEVYGINVPLSILMGKHDKSVQRVHGYEGLRYFNAGTIHSVDWWKALTNQLVEVDHYIDTILMKSTNNGGYSYQKYVVSTPGRLYLAGLTSAQYEVNKRNGYHYIPTELFDEQKHKYNCSFVNTALRSMIDLEMKTKRPPSSSITQKQQSIRNTSSSASKHLSLSDTTNSSRNRIFKFVSLQMAFDPQKVMNHHHHHRPQPSHLERDASIQSDEPNNNQRVKQNQSMRAKLRSALYQELRQLRHTMAEEKKINPYDILGAPELERLVALDPLPTTPQDLSRVPGFSDWKIRSFGSELIHVILSFQERHADDYKALQALSSKEGCKDSSTPIHLVASERVVTPLVRPTVKLFHPSYDDTNINEASPICNLIDKRKAVDVHVPTQKMVDEIEGDFLSLLAKNEELLMRSESKVVRIDTGVIFCVAENNDNAPSEIQNENTITNIGETSMNSRVVAVEPHPVNSSNPYQLDRDHGPTATSSTTSSTVINAVSTGSHQTHKPSDNAWRKRQGMISGLSAYKARKDPKLNRAPTV